MKRNKKEYFLRRLTAGTAALALSGGLVVSAGTTALAEEEKTYDTTVSFSMTSYNTITGVDYTADEFYSYLAEKFNIVIDVWANETEGASEKERIWMNGGTMPDCMIWEDFTFSEYYTYIDQGLLQPLPDGWEETWPWLAKLVEKSGYAEALKVDGQTYAIPHSVFGNYMDMETNADQISLYFRADWAEEVGMGDMGDDYVVTLSELREYLEKVAEAGLASKPALGGSTYNVQSFFFNAMGIPPFAYMELEDEGFIWCPEYYEEEIVEMIETMREWYQAGLIDPDFFDASLYDYRTAFEAGELAAMYDSGDCVNAGTFRSTYAQEFPDEDEFSDIKYAAIANDDGTVYCQEAENYWTMQVFSPETDEETLERILDLMNWIASPEGEASCQIGIPDVDWAYDEDGEIEIINEDGVYTSQEALYLLGYCNDDFAYSGVKTGLNSQNIEDTLAIYEVKLAGVVYPYSRNYQTYGSTLRSNYSVDFNSKIVELTCGTEDIASAWSDFIEENRSMWEPLLEELNENFG